MQSAGPRTVRGVVLTSATGEPLSISNSFACTASSPTTVRSAALCSSQIGSYCSPSLASCLVSPLVELSACRSAARISFIVLVSLTIFFSLLLALHWPLCRTAFSFRPRMSFSSDERQDFFTLENAATRFETWWVVMVPVSSSSVAAAHWTRVTFFCSLLFFDVRFSWLRAHLVQASQIQLSVIGSRMKLSHSRE